MNNELCTIQNKPNQTQSVVSLSNLSCPPQVDLSAVAGFYEASAKENGEGGFKRLGLRGEMSRESFCQIRAEKGLNSAIFL